MISSSRPSTGRSVRRGGSGGTNASATVDPPGPEFVSYAVPTRCPKHDRRARRPRRRRARPLPTARHRPLDLHVTDHSDQHDADDRHRRTTPSTRAPASRRSRASRPAGRSSQALLALLKAETAQLKAEEHGNSPGGSAGGHPIGSGSGNGSGNGSGSGSGNGSGAGSGGGSGPAVDPDPAVDRSGGDRLRRWIRLRRGSGPAVDPAPAVDPRPAVDGSGQAPAARPRSSRPPRRSSS